MGEQGPQFGVALHREGARIVVQVAGELDLATAPRLRKVLCEVVGDGERRVVVDLGALEFIDLSGLEVLEHIGRELAHHHGQFVLRHPSRQTSRLLALRGEWERDQPWEIER